MPAVLAIGEANLKSVTAIGNTTPDTLLEMPRISVAVKQAGRAASEERGWIGENLRVVALVGFIGAFTTFSTFAFDNVQMARASEWAWFGANMLLTNVGGLVAVYAGFRVARVV